MKGLLKIVVPLLLLVSCGTSRPLVNYETNPIPAGLSLNTIQTTIVKAGAKRGWLISKTAGKNILVATLKQRQHTVVLNIPFTTSNYALEYYTSTNLDYNASRNTIHRSYLRWLEYLKSDIDTALIIETTQQK